MNQRISFDSMKLKILLLVAMVAILPGCGKEFSKALGLGLIGDRELHDVIRSNIESSGGFSTWSKVASLEARILATTQDIDGGETFLNQRHIYTPKISPSMISVTQSPDGNWVENLTPESQVQMYVEHKEDQPEQDKDVLYGAGIKLALISQSVSQCFGLLRDGWDLSYAGLERRGGRVSHKIVMSGKILNRPVPRSIFNEIDEMVVWVDSETNLVDRVWLKFWMSTVNGHRQYTYLGANVKNYQKDACGLMLPHYIGLVRCDEYQQFSESEILRLEYKSYQANIQIEKKSLFDF